MPQTGCAVHVVFGRAGELDSIEEEEILLRAIAGDREVVGRGGVGDAGAASFLGSEIDDARIERQEQVVAAAIERKLFYGALTHQAADVQRRSADHGGVALDCDFRLHRGYLQAQIDGGFLVHDQLYTSTDGVLKTGLGNGHLILPNRKREHQIAPGVVGETATAGTGFEILGFYRGGGNRRSQGVDNDALNASRHLGAGRR
jgi:hypothetical protein